MLRFPPPTDAFTRCTPRDADLDSRPTNYAAVIFDRKAEISISTAVTPQDTPQLEEVVDVVNAKVLWTFTGKFTDPEMTMWFNTVGARTIAAEVTNMEFTLDMQAFGAHRLGLIDEEPIGNRMVAELPTGLFIGLGLRDHTMLTALSRQFATGYDQDALNMLRRFMAVPRQPFQERPDYVHDYVQQLN